MGEETGLLRRGNGKLVISSTQGWVGHGKEGGVLGPASLLKVRVEHLALCPGPELGCGLHAAHPTQVQTANP